LLFEFNINEGKARGAHIFKKSTSHHKIPGGRSVTWS